MSDRRVIRYLWPQLARGRGEAERELTVEELRWSVRGEVRTRETFGDPHPDDFPGQNGQESLPCPRLPHRPQS